MTLQKDVVGKISSLEQLFLLFVCLSCFKTFCFFLVMPYFAGIHKLCKRAVNYLIKVRDVLKKTVY